MAVLVLALIVVLVVVVLLALVPFFRQQARRKYPLLSGLIAKYLMPVYCAVLLLSTVLVYTLPISGLISGAGRPAQNSSFSPAPAFPLMEIAEQGQLDGCPGIYKNDEQIYMLAGDELELEISPNMDSQVLIRRLDIPEKKISVKSYVTYHYVQNIDIKEKILPPQIRLEGKTLLLNPPDKYSLTFIDFRDSFTSIQFAKAKSPSPSGNFYFGQKIIYIEVPQSINLLPRDPNIVVLPAV